MPVIRKMTAREIAQAYPGAQEVLAGFGLGAEPASIEALCAQKGLDAALVTRALAEPIERAMKAQREVMLGGRVWRLREICRGYVRSAFVYLLAGSTLGVSLSVPGALGWWNQISGGRISLAHAHLQFLGFLMMLVYGVGYQIIPSMSGRKQTRSARLALAQLVVANIGVAGMAAAFAFAAIGGWLPLFAVFAWLGVALFIYNLW